MKGLLWKDLYTIKRYAKQYVFMVVFAFVLMFTTKNSFYLNSMLMIMTMSIMISLLAVDEKEKWYDIILTMPVGRKLIVKEKYIFLCLSMLGTFVVSAAGGAFISFALKESYQAYMLTTLIMIFFYLIMLSIILPLIYKYGTEKTRIMMLAVFGIPAVVIVLFAELFSTMEHVIEFILLKSVYFIPVILAAVLFLSYRQSIKIFSKREF